MSERHEQLEQLIGRALRDLPPRQAPESLEGLVLREIERRAALPWWHKNFMHWPQLARIAFVLGLLGVVKLALNALVWLTTSVRESHVATAIEQPVGWFHATSSVTRSMGVAAEAVLSAIPSQWLYAALLGGLVMYVALFGVGAAVYRTLNK